MKNMFILIILLSCLKLSASAIPIDTPKVATLNTPASRFENQDFTLTVVCRDCPRLLIAINLQDDRKSPTERRRDSLKFIEYAYIDSLEQRLKFMGLDSLKLLLKLKYEYFKAPLYTEIASRYLKFDSVSTENVLAYKENEALKYTMMALHQYNKHEDSTGLRVSFDALAKIYLQQKKYSQAKWFILQSNTISRYKNDVPEIITSLITLSVIKCEIKDYKLAAGDLEEALQLCIKHRYLKLESEVLREYAYLYSRANNYSKEAVYLKKRDILEKNIRQIEQDSLMAKVTARNALQKKKTGSLLHKKKV